MHIIFREGTSTRGILNHCNSSLDNSLETLSYYMHILGNGSYYAARNFSNVLYEEIIIESTLCISKCIARTLLVELYDLRNR